MIKCITILKSPSLPIFFCLLIVSSHLQALSPEPAEAQPRPIAITGVTIHIGTGEVIEQGVVTFSAGKIISVTSTAPDSASAPDLSGHQVLDYSGKHLYPGFVLPLSRIGLVETNAQRETRDYAERGSLNPNLHVHYAFNTDSEIIPTLRFNGVLTAQVVPNGALLAGQSSIMQLDAWNFEDALVLVDDAMHLYWPKEYKAKYDYSSYETTYPANETYEPLIESLVMLFENSERYSGPGMLGKNQKLVAVQKVIRGETSLFIHAVSAKEIIAALDFVRTQGLPDVVLVTGQGALEVIDLIKALDIPVIVRGIHELPGGKDDDIDIVYSTPAKLLDAGIKVGLAATTRQAPAGDRNLPFMAGHAAAYGLDKEAAVRMITLSNAEILGISDRLGSIEVGKSATLFVAEGDALDMRGNTVLRAYIDGRSIVLQGTQQALYERFKRKYQAGQ